MWLRMDAAVDGFGQDGCGQDGCGQDGCGRDGRGGEEWGKRLAFVVSLDRVSRRRMCEGWHPDAGAGLRMQGRKGVGRWRG